ncbi:hypothetical protein K1T71_008612 [Dendrolimus kikuchii]|uniref:Uncharacterized protein n=1 Tax=Dendrolimus kikuchii TaxID=765133 RepID=A0ACC1CV75_9NEOP|nr:hypothetical protein K1T71_008612 [Dendrolimus kikuchii]
MASLQRNMFAYGEELNKPDVSQYRGPLGPWAVVGRQHSSISNLLVSIYYLMLAVNPYHIPNKSLNEFVEDIKKVARDMRLVHLNEKNVESLRCKYNLIVVYAQK